MDNFKNLLKRTIPENIRITTFLENELLPAMADEGQLDQVIMNLAANSAEAMPSGGIITIETDLVYLDQEYAAKHVNVEPGQYVMLAISDTGTGMDPETAKLIFDPFFSTKGDQGTGLGLATVYGIVRQHNGNIWVYSEPGKGTTSRSTSRPQRRVFISSPAGPRSALTPEAMKPSCWWRTTTTCGRCSTAS